MNQTVYYKIFILSFILLMLSPLEARLIKPSQNGEEKEILIVNNKRRLYYPVKEEGLVYSVAGPIRLEFISRLPVLKKKKQSHSYGYLIILDNKDTVRVNHRYKVQRSIRSVQHSKHSYTHSGNYFINLDKGQHSIQIIENKKQKYPVLIRLLTKDFESLGKKTEVISPMIHQNSVDLITGDKVIKYFECTPGLPLQLQVSGKKTLRIMTRLEFSDVMGQEDSYRLRIKEGKKVVGTYYFNTERSSATQIKNKQDKVPGKWRSCEISISKGKHTYSVEVADKDKTILTRFITY